MAGVSSWELTPQIPVSVFPTRAWKCAEDLTAPMFFGIMNATPPSESVEECTPGSVDTEDEAKILTMGYDEGAYDVIGDHELR